MNFRPKPDLGDRPYGSLRISGRVTLGTVPAKAL